MSNGEEQMDPLAELAGEYALGLLTGEDLRRAQELEREDEGFRREVARWQWRLSPVLEETKPVQPPAAVWQNVERLMARGRLEDDRSVIKLRLQMRRWRAVAGGMTAMAASLALVLLAPMFKPQEPRRAATQASIGAAPLVAMLGAPSEGTKVVASWNPAAHQLVLAVPGELKSDPAHSHELWVIPRGGKPRSLGTMPKSRQMHMELAQALARLLEQGATIAISVEPRGGSPSGAPTGPVVAAGALTQA